MKDLSLHILDIVQNSLRAEASFIEIYIEESVLNNTMCITIRDNGIGMGKYLLKKVTDPYFTTRTTRKVGMGIPLFRQSAEMAGGNLRIESKKGKGTTIQVNFIFDHIDRPSLGDVVGVFCIMVQANEKIRFLYQHKTDKGDYLVDTKEIKNALGESSFNDPKIMQLIKEMITENLKDIKISKYYA